MNKKAKEKQSKWDSVTMENVKVIVIDKNKTNLKRNNIVIADAWMVARNNAGGLNDLEEPEGFKIAPRREDVDKLPNGICLTARKQYKLDELEKAKEHLKILNEIVKEKDHARNRAIQNMEIERIDLPRKDGNGNEIVAFIRAGKMGKNELIVLVDDDEWHDLRKYEWSLGSKKGYISGIVEGQKTLIYRYNMRDQINHHLENSGEDVIVDHINRNKLDERKAELRLASASANSQNKAKKVNTSSQYIGVIVAKGRSKFTAGIAINGKKKHIRNFDF
ncbi:hypothetical protein BDK51DRAFT_31787 [Blyttiomyces helicus]|uniref:HNH nuclease domain-containing protein n=1 Tax=Blyttiomyces helicus TaxID=388810 RepID=A0A4P9WIE6_9FUNG|nr:hypothetical protein BDK51DRAFT_31787 [Blyttiomyces helicus]|eukprot:RKO92192.1 hypothetical protein BDK51DRAFT_31787 [Blyttiomyces helicus]